MIAVYRIGLSKDQLATLQPSERALLVLAGHALNQITITLKLVALSTNHDPANEIESRVSAGQSQTLTRFLIGVLGETVVWLNRRENQRPIGKVYLPAMDDMAAAIYDTVKKHIGGSSLLQRARNRFAFHFPSEDDVEEAFAYAPSDQDWSLYMAEKITNLMWLSSELVTGFGMISAAGIADPAEGMRRIMNEAMVFADAASDFLMRLIGVMMEQHFGPDALRPEHATDVSDSPSGQTFWLPFYLEPPLGRRD